MKKLLITGFEPFGGETINPSWKAVKALPDEINGYELTKICLPVVFGEAAEHLIRTADELVPDVILCIGQAGGRNAVTPELVAINLRHATIPDNGGNQPKDEQIAEDMLSVENGIDRLPKPVGAGIDLRLAALLGGD